MPYFCLQKSKITGDFLSFLPGKKLTTEGKILQEFRSHKRICKKCHKAWYEDSRRANRGIGGLLKFYCIDCAIEKYTENRLISEFF